MTTPIDFEAPDEPEKASSEPAVSLIMPTICWGHPFDHCVRAAMASLRPADELLVVFDGMAPPAPEWLLASGAVLLQTGKRSGPGAARNLAAQRASCPILLFVDADVALHADAVERTRAQFNSDSKLQALFGSYDDAPAAPGLVSRFRNLLHHHTHTSQAGPACTFWAGCGAVRRDRFLALGGFDAESYRKPCIEDIEFGLRLHDDGGRILLDPTIQGTHLKRWTLGLMVRTDIQQRAIPWSRLLLSRRQLPATLNLSLASRLSGGFSLLVLAALLALAIPMLWPWSLLTGIGALAGLLLLNRSLLALLLQRGGPALAVTGAALLTLYYSYSCIAFASVASSSVLNSKWPSQLWLGLTPTTRQRIWILLLTLLAILGLFHTLRGSTGLILGKSSDLQQRYDEWRLFQAGIYPDSNLADEEALSLPYFRTSVYLPFALPMFGILFGLGGFWQGKMLILIGSLISLAVIATIGWHSLRPWGGPAGCLGALAPLAIMGNSMAINIGQFSIICMGLLSLQWILIRRERHYPAALCWALAMIKPQIALFYALPMLRVHRLPALVMSILLLMGLSAAAFVHTGTPPAVLMASWFGTLEEFAGGHNKNIIAGLLPLFNTTSLAFLLIPLTAAGVICMWLGNRLAHRADLFPGAVLLDLAGLSAILGYVSFYHVLYDKIMLYPALLACLRSIYMNPRAWPILLTALMAATVWLPQKLLDTVPNSTAVQSLIWTLVGFVLVLRIIRPNNKRGSKVSWSSNS
jgi:hypothetical protein